MAYWTCPSLLAHHGCNQTGSSTPKCTLAACRSRALSCTICGKKLVANSCREQGGSELASQSGSHATWSVFLRSVGRQHWEPGTAAYPRACTPSSCKQRKTREGCIAQSSCVCTIPGSVSSQLGQGFEHTGSVQSIPAQDAHGRRVATR